MNYWLLCEKFPLGGKVTNKYEIPLPGNVLAQGTEGEVIGEPYLLSAYGNKGSWWVVPIDFSGLTIHMVPRHLDVS
jgi:hypothetical protein